MGDKSLGGLVIPDDGMRCNPGKSDRGGDSQPLKRTGGKSVDRYNGGERGWIAEGALCLREARRGWGDAMAVIALD